MRRKTLTIMVLLCMLSITWTPRVIGYSQDITIGSIIEWSVDAAPAEPFNMFYSEGGFWLAENGSSMTFQIQSIGEDIVGQLSIGNVTVIANDTEIAKDLTFGVWGTPTEWWPGLIVDVGQQNIENLNATAFASAERVLGNYLNGTMMSYYDNISIGMTLIECIIFDYEQDPTGFGDPQITHLAYSVADGLLVEARTRYSFGVPYNLQIMLVSSGTPTDNSIFSPFPLILLGALLAAIVIIYVILSKR